MLELDPDIVLPWLIETLSFPRGRGTDEEIRTAQANAAHVLIEFGVHAMPVVDDLKEHLTSGFASTRMYAAMVLGELRYFSHDALPSLVPLLMDANEDVRDHALWALDKIEIEWAERRDTEEAYGNLYGALQANRNDANCVKRFVWAWREIGLRNREVAPVKTLIGFLDHDDESVRSAAEYALNRIDRTWPKHSYVKEFVGSLFWEFKKSGFDASKPMKSIEARLSAVKSIGSDARSILPQLTELLEQRDPEIRLLVVETLGSVGTPNVDAILPILNDNDSDIRWEAWHEFGDFAVQESQSGEVKILLQSKHKDVQENALRALGSFARKLNHNPVLPFNVVDDQQLAVDLLSTAEEMRDRDDRLVSTAAESACNEIGRATIRKHASAKRHLIGDFVTLDKDDVQLLIKLLADPNPALRRASANILSFAGPDGKAVLPDLRGIVDDSDPHVQAAVRHAISRITSEVNQRE